MNTNTQIAELIEQLRENGDVAALLAGYDALTASHTTPLGLNQWQLSDKPTMVQFNSDNEIIDGKLRELDSALSKKADRGTEQRYDFPFNTGFETATIGAVNEYSKNAFDRVSLSLVVKRSDDGIINSSYIGTLPTGFRPSGTHVSACYGQKSNEDITSGAIQVSSDGMVYIAILEAMSVFG